MRKQLTYFFIALISTALFFSTIAEAKRFGGGASFGGKSSYSSPYKKSTAPNKSFSQQKAAAANQQKKQQFAQRGGLMGILGGLALGGLLGALFFGGAFEGLNFFDFLMIGGIIFAIYWFMKRKQTSMSARPATAGAAGHYATEAKQNSTQFDTSHADPLAANSSQLKEQINRHYHNSDDADFSEDFNTDNSSEKQQMLPQWFNQEEFLNGARSAYMMLQEAWDSGNLEQIKQLTTPSVYTEIHNQLQDHIAGGATRILRLNAELIDFNELDEQTEAAVMFDNLIAENDAQGNEGRATQVRELWHFIRAKDSTAPTWYLDGIQQIDA